MSDPKGRARILAELEAAEAARRRGLEGRARVCARRAAGWSVESFYRQATGRPGQGNALVLLRWLSDLPSAPTEVRAAAKRLTVAVNPDHALPHEADPLADARLLVNEFTGGAVGV